MAVYNPGINPNEIGIPAVTSPDYHGSYDEWLQTAARSMAEDYMRGTLDLSQFSTATAGLGQPNQSDFGSGTNGQTGYISDQTYRFFLGYAQAGGGSDPYMINQFGPPPSQHATYEPNPNSPSELAKINAASSKYTTDTNAAVAREGYASSERIAAGHDATEAAIAAGNNATSLSIAGMQQATAMAGFANDWKIATLNDATRRYVAEGDWGTQKYVTQLQEKGAMDRLLLTLKDNEKDRAVRAQAEANRHHESMLGLVFEVAKYDAELAAQPVNWLKYAGWLQNRGIVVNGLSLAMAADTVPDQAIGPAEVQASTGSGTAALQTFAETRQALVSGQSGGSQQPASALAQTAPMTSTSPPPQPVPGAQIGGVDLNSTDYSAIARQLLGMNPMGQDQPPTSADLQAISDSLNTQPGQRVTGFGGYTGPTSNALGVTGIQNQGQQTDYRQFSSLLPSQQQMKLGAVQSTGRYLPDYLKELENSRPKGFAAQTASFG